MNYSSTSHGVLQIQLKWWSAKPTYSTNNATLHECGSRFLWKSGRRIPDCTAPLHGHQEFCKMNICHYNTCSRISWLPLSAVWEPMLGVNSVHFKYCRLQLYTWPTAYLINSAFRHVDSTYVNCNYHCAWASLSFSSRTSTVRPCQRNLKVYTIL